MKDLTRRQLKPIILLLNPLIPSILSVKNAILVWNAQLEAKFAIQFLADR
jgi:hypothetical protein